jgi:hypothetical protein
MRLASRSLVGRRPLDRVHQMHRNKYPLRKPRQKRSRLTDPASPRSNAFPSHLANSNRFHVDDLVDREYQTGSTVIAIIANVAV